MKYGVICYAVHNKKISTLDWFDDIDDAVIFLHDNAQDTYEVIEDGAEYDNVHHCIVGHHATVSINNGEYEWTWDIIDDSER